MFTTGLKLFLGLTVAGLVGAIVYGYSSGGTGLGPVILGWEGGVGDHVGYSIFLGLAVGAGLMATFSAVFRDADAEAVASYLGVARAPVGQVPTGASYWPLAAALGAGVVVVGLVAGAAVFIAGLVVLALVAIEWTMSAWADRATGDPEVNRELRDRVMRPFEVPVLGFIGAGVIVLAMSRIFLNVSKTGAVVAAGVLATLFFCVAIFLAIRPKFPRHLGAAIVGLGLVGVLVWGIVSAAAGQREFEEHGEHGGHSEEGEEVVEGAEG